MTLRSQVLTGLKWAALGKLSSQLVTWAITIYVIRLLSPEDYGLMALATIFSALFSFIAEIGLGPTLVQTKDLPRERIRQIFGLVLLSNGGVFLLMTLAVAPAVSYFFGEPRLTVVIQIISLSFIPAAFAVIPSALLERDMRFRGRAIIDLFSTIGSALVTLTAAQAGYGVFALAWGAVAQALFRAIGLNIAGSLPGLPLFKFQGCASMFHFGRNVAATQLVWFFYSQADAFIVGKFLGKHDLGVYSVSMDLASLPASRISAILNQVVFPSFSKVKRDGGYVAPYLLKGMRGISLIAVPVMWGMSSIAPEMIQVLLGQKWLEAALPLSLLCLIMPLRVLSPLVHSGLHAVGRADVSFRITSITATVMCTGFLIGTQFGLLGLSIAWLSLFPCVFLYNLIDSGRHLGLTARDIVINLGRPAMAGILMYGTVSLFRLLLDPTQALVNLVLLIASGAIAYVAFSFVFNRAGIAEVRSLVSRHPA